MRKIRNTLRHYHGVVVGLGVALAASSCGGSGDDGGTGDKTGTGTSTGAGATEASTAATTSPTSGATSGANTSSASASTSDATTGGASTSSATTGGATTGDATTGDATTGGVMSTGGGEASLSFFVSSTGSATADLGGLAGADKRCQELADMVGAGDRTWHAYLSAEDDGNGQPVHAKDRIGQGPWYNAKLVMVAADLADLHTKEGDPELFLDEHGEKVPGQWAGSPAPNEHDILTGSNKDGTLLAGKTCADWTSTDPSLFAQIGHSDGLGPMGNDAPQYRSWNSVHENGGCHDTAPKGGGGRVYCFAID